MMKRMAFLSVLIFILFALPLASSAQDDAPSPFAGVYDISYVENDVTHPATLIITESGGNYRVVWVFHQDGGVGVGIGLPLDDNHLAVASNGADEPLCSLNVLHMDDDGTLTGNWKSYFPWYGPLTMTPTGDSSDASPAGSFDVSYRLPPGNQISGTGNIREVHDNIYNVTWDLQDVPNAAGVGFVAGDYFVSSTTEVGEQNPANAAPSCGIEVFTLQEDGSIIGEWTGFGEREIGTETPVRIH
ncbi:MAG: hypothetical protein ABI835_13850 [Chloroflexota bacterium]